MIINKPIQPPVTVPGTKVLASTPVRAGCLNDGLPGVTVKQRLGLSQDGGFLRVIGTHEAEHLSDCLGRPGTTAPDSSSALFF